MRYLFRAIALALAFVVGAGLLFLALDLVEALYPSGMTVGQAVLWVAFMLVDAALASFLFAMLWRAGEFLDDT
jgi:hypothetical protein